MYSDVFTKFQKSHRWCLWRSVSYARQRPAWKSVQIAFIPFKAQLRPVTLRVQILSKIIFATRWCSSSDFRKHRMSPTQTHFLLWICYDITLQFSLRKDEVVSPGDLVKGNKDALLSSFKKLKFFFYDACYREKYCTLKLPQLSDQFHAEFSNFTCFESVSKNRKAVTRLFSDESKYVGSISFCLWNTTVFVQNDF